MIKMIFYELEKQEEEQVIAAFPHDQLLFIPTPLTPQDIQAPWHTKTSRAFHVHHPSPTFPISDAQIISIFVCSTVTASVLDQFPHVRLIVTRSTGFDHIDIAECQKRSITVLNLAQYATVAVAEFTIALMLALGRKLITATSTNIETCPVDFMSLRGLELFGKTLGIIGLGAIGSKVAHLAHAFNMSIFGYDQYHNPELIKKYNVQYTTLNELLQKSDIITLHTPLTPATHYLINSKTIGMMKPGVLLINTSRGGVVDAAALVDGLHKGIIAGAAIDVLEYECCHEQDYEGQHTRKLKESRAQIKRIVDAQRELACDARVIITPHIAFNSEDAIKRRITDTIECIRQWQKVSKA